MTLDQLAAQLQAARARVKLLQALAAEPPPAGAAATRQVLADLLRALDRLQAAWDDWCRQQAALLAGRLDSSEPVGSGPERAGFARRLAAEQSRLVAIVEQMPFGVLIVEGASGRPSIQNAELTRLLGHPAPHSTSLTLDGESSALHADGTPYRSDEYPLARALLGEVVRDEMLYQRADGMVLYLSVNAAPLRDPDGRIAAAICTFHDLAELKQAERDRQRLASEQAARAAAELAEGKLRALLETMPDGILVYDRDGRILMVNARAEQLFGYSRQELLGRLPELLLPERFRARHVQHRAAYGSAPSTRPMGTGLELVGRRKDGSEFPVEVSLSALQTTDGLLLTSVIRDITDRKLAERERERLLGLERLAQDRALDAEARYRHLFEGTADAVLVAGADSRLVNANRAALALLGYEQDELSQLPVGDLLTNDLFCSDAEQDRFLAEGYWRGELELRRKDGSVVPVEASVALVPLPSGQAFVAVLRDISDRRMLERLRQEVSALATRELRAPLAAIAGYASLLDRRRRYDRRTILAILEEAARLERLVDDLRDTTHLAVGRLDLHRERVDLLALAHAAVDRAQVRRRSRRVRLEAPAGQVLGRWDPDRLAQVLDALLEHAAARTPRGAETVLRVENLGSQALVSIADPGPQITSDLLPRLFDRFPRPPGRVRRSSQGSPPALWIARRLIEAHGGRVWIESQRGEPTTITFILPAAPPPSRDALEPRLTPRQLEIVALIAQGKTNQQIAETLVLSKGTVDNHVDRILSRLGVRNRAQVAAWAAERGLAPFPEP